MVEQLAERHLVADVDDDSIAVSLDGASELQMFRQLTLPLLRPIMLFVLVTSIGFYGNASAVVLRRPADGFPSNASN